MLVVRAAKINGPNGPTSQRSERWLAKGVPAAASPGWRLEVLNPAWTAGSRMVKRRGRDLNPRRTKPPETVFETAAFARSAPPPRSLAASLQISRDKFSVAAGAGLCPAGGEERAER